MTTTPHQIHLSRLGKALAVVLCAVTACTFPPERTDTESLASTPRLAAASCYSGALTACDELAESTSPDSQLQEYGQTCGGRTTAAQEPCSTQFGEAIPLPADAIPEPTSALEGLMDDCEDGEIVQCDGLGRAAASGTAVALFAATCGGRVAQPINCQLEVGALLPTPLPFDVEAAVRSTLVAARDCEGGLMAACDSLRTSQDPVLALYGERCGGRRVGVDSCSSWFQDRETPIGLPLTVNAGDTGLLAGCQDGELQSCDELGRSSDSQLELYGETCGGRNNLVSSCQRTYANMIGTPGDGADLLQVEAQNLIELAFSCQGSDWSACDHLASRASEARFDLLERYGATCGGRSAVTSSCLTDPLLSLQLAADDYRTLNDTTEERNNALARSCAADNWTACIELASQAGPGYEEYQTFAEQCGGYVEPSERPVACIDAFNAAAIASVSATTRPIPGPPTSIQTAPSPPPTSAPDATSGGSRLSDEQRMALLEAVASSLQVTAVSVDVQDDLKVGEAGRWDVSIAEPVSIGFPAEPIHTQVRVQLDIRYNGKPGDYTVQIVAQQPLTADIRGAEAQVAPGLIAEMVVTPQISGSDAPSLLLTLTDESGTLLETVQLAVPDQEIEGRGLVQGTLHFLNTNGVVLLAGGIAGVIIIVRRLREWAWGLIKLVLRPFGFRKRRTLVMSIGRRRISTPSQRQFRSAINTQLNELPTNQWLVLEDQRSKGALIAARRLKGDYELQYRESRDDQIKSAFCDNQPDALEVLEGWAANDSRWKEALTWGPLPKPGQGG